MSQPFRVDVESIRARARARMEQGSITEAYGLQSEHVVSGLDDAIQTYTEFIRWLDNQDATPSPKDGNHPLGRGGARPPSSSRCAGASSRRYSSAGMENCMQEQHRHNEHGITGESETEEDRELAHVAACGRRAGTEPPLAPPPRRMRFHELASLFELSGDRTGRTPR